MTFFIFLYEYASSDICQQWKTRNAWNTLFSRVYTLETPYKVSPMYNRKYRSASTYYPMRSLNAYGGEAPYLFRSFCCAANQPTDRPMRSHRRQRGQEKGGRIGDAAGQRTSGWFEAGGRGEVARPAGKRIAVSASLRNSITRAVLL